MADGVDWNSVLGGVLTGVPLGGLALKLAFDMIREKDKRIEELHNGHQQDLREAATREQQQRENSERLLERVLEGLQRLAELRTKRADADAGGGGGGGSVRGSGGGGAGR